MPPLHADQPKGRVLAVDDCPIMREVLRATLERRGYAVLAVDSGWAALQAAQRERFDAVILDVEMPGMDGMAVGRALRSSPNTAQAKIAMHSSLDEAAVRLGFSQYDAFMPKARSLRELGEQLDQWLGESRALDIPV